MIHTATIEVASVTAGSSLGGSPTWSAYKTISCRVQPMKNSDREIYDRRGTERTHAIYTVTDPDINDGARYRILFGTRVFDDLSQKNFDEWSRYWRIDCREVTHDQ